MNVYLDYAATSPLRQEVLDAMLPYFTAEFGNPDSLHTFGREAAYAVTNARDLIAETLGVKPNEVYFTSGGTEADNWAVRFLGQGPAAVSSAEHAAVLSAAPLRAGGYRLVRTERTGLVSLPDVEETLGEGAKLVCVMAVNNETGCIQPAEEAAALAHAHGALFFSDCVQAACSQDLKEICSFADAVSLSAHKFGGPKGVGVLVVKRGVALGKLIAGGEQERGLRGGTLNVAGIVGMAKALALAQAERDDFRTHCRNLRDTFENLLLGALREGVTVNGEHRAENISDLTFAGGGETFLNVLDLKGVAASGGAACSAHAALPSHVLLAMGRGEDEARRAVRFSFGRETTLEEVRFAAETVIACLALRSRN